MNLEASILRSSRGNITYKLKAKVKVTVKSDGRLKRNASPYENDGKDASHDA